MKLARENGVSFSRVFLFLIKPKLEHFTGKLYFY